MEDAPLPAGPLSAWLDGMQRALRDGDAADVPCGDCTACCTSSQFVHIAPDETDTLASIPVALLFPAPGAPPGHVVLGYDEHGRCPMLVDARCSIYEHRPRTCRTYDCRIFAATGVEVDEPALVDIGRRARRWRFDVTAASDRTCSDALVAAAQQAPAGSTATGRAVWAVRSLQRRDG